MTTFSFWQKFRRFKVFQGLHFLKFEAFYTFWLVRYKKQPRCHTNFLWKISKLNGIWLSAKFKNITVRYEGQFLRYTNSTNVSWKTFDLINLLNLSNKCSIFQVFQGISRFYPISRSLFSPKIKFQAFQGCSRYRGHPAIEMWGTNIVRNCISK